MIERYHMAMEARFLAFCQILANVTGHSTIDIINFDQIFKVYPVNKYE